MAIPKCGDEACLDADCDAARAPVSLSQTEKATLLGLVAEADGASGPVAFSARERLVGDYTKGTNFGRDTHESALGSTVTSVRLSVDEIDLLVSRLGSSESPLASSLAGKLTLLRLALAPPAEEPDLAAVAASVGLGALAAGERPSIVPVTVLTGCLGAGKTTVIRSLLRQLPEGYSCAWLKNEYGDAGVDRVVAQDSRVEVREIVNGCLCCTKVGELADALRALHELNPHRILVEASGSAMPGPLVWEIEKVCDIVRVDGVVTVVDCANFARINNFTHTAKIQAKCTDLILLNKVELAGERLLDDVLDDLHELVPEAPKVPTRGERATIDPALIFGLDTALWRSSEGGAVRPASLEEEAHMAEDAECFHALPDRLPGGWSADRACLEALMRAAPPDDLYRSKGVVPLSFEEAAAEAARQGLAPCWGEGEGGSRLGDTWWLFNGVAGRLTLEPLLHTAGPTSLVLMGRNLKQRMPKIEAALRLPAGTVTNVYATAPPVLFGERLITCGVAKGLAAPE